MTSNGLSLTLLCLTALPGRAQFADRSFRFSHEFYGDRAYRSPDAAANLLNGMANGVTLWAPVDAGMREFAADQAASVIVNLFGATKVMGTPASSIEIQHRAIDDLGKALGSGNVAWNLMPEWDQSGGLWVPAGRPRYRDLNRSLAYSRFMGYYRNSCAPLETYLRQPASERNYALAAVTDHAMNAFYAYELGVELNLLERGIDELGDLSTGIAFARGAARQSDRRWGIDLSTWRTSNDRATEYDERGILQGGWSESYVKRHFYAAYMSGAHVLQSEAAVYRFRDGRLNPFGEVTREFADFALRRHPDVGLPTVSMALLIDHYSGFDTKHWIYNQANAVWYQDIPYSDGDFMIDNFLRAAYPGHWLHGQTPGAPFARPAGAPDAAKFREYLRGGGDPRPYEPMSSTRWGDNLDIITNSASLETLRHYKAIAVLGSVAMDSRLRGALTTWVREGGVLVLNIRGVELADEDLLGARLTETVRAGSSSRWLADGTDVPESVFRYTLVQPTTAGILASGGQGDALVTVNRVGQGEVVLTTPHYLQTGARDQFLAVGVRLFDWLQARFAPAQVAGPPIEYIVNQAPDRVIVTLINNSGEEWRGNITTGVGGAAAAVREYTRESEAEFTVSGEKVRVAAQVPPYEVRIYAVEFSENGRGAARAAKPLPDQSRNSKRSR